MPLTPGTRLGPYEIVAPLGQGGMGEVYRAHDPRTGREVAIKVAAERFSERFSREVQAIAALNHPNICQLYDVGPNYLVLELVEGETLRGPLPLETALGYARQIAEALEAAHEKGIIHRDLKPANVRVRPDGTVKVLDFGLAKRIEPAGSGEAGGAWASNSPTLSLAATRAGVILGTAAYMAPEQARGREADRRADIWAFGCVLYEMLTGRRLFRGDDMSETLAAVIKDEPPLDDVPEQVRPLLRRCLRKDPKERLRDIGDAWALLEAGNARSSSERAVETGGTPRPERLVLWSAAGLMALVAAGAVAWAVRGGDGVPAAPVRFEIPPPEEATLLVGATPTISPDGRLLAFPAAGTDGVYRIWIRALETLEARPLPGTENATTSLLVWSPDSRHLAFATGIPRGGVRPSAGFGGLVRTIAVSGGPPQTACELAVSSAAVGGSWNRDGTIILGDSNGGLMRAPAGGGPCSPLTTLRPEVPEQHLFPVFLPDGRHFLYIAQAYSVEQDRPAGFYDVYVGSLDAKPEDQKIKKLLTTDHGVQYVPSGEPGSGRILFVREGTLFAQAFDPERLELTGEATPIAQDIGTLYANPYFSASSGVLVYRTRAGNQYQLTWLDRDGRELGRPGEPIFPRTLALSPDGTRAAFESYADAGLFVVDLVRGTTTRLGRSVGVGLAWAPDGARIAFSQPDLYQTRASGVGDAEALLSSPEPEFKAPLDWSRDGRFLLYQRTSLIAGSGPDLFALPLDGDRTPFPVVQTSSDEGGGRLSPDGRLMAYTSNKSGRDEVYVRPFAPPSAGAPREAGEEWTISKGGSNTMFGWRGDGRELWYRTADNRIMAVAVTEGPRFGDARLMFQLPPGTVAAATNGERILAAVPTEASTRVPITVVLNWPSLITP